MAEVLLLLAGLVVGSGLAWGLARGHYRARAIGEREALSARLAAAEAVGDGARKQLTQSELDLGEARQALERERMSRVQAELRVETARDNVEEQKRLLADAQARLTDTFKALSAEALRDSTANFAALAGDRLDAQLAQRQEAIDGLVRPLQDALRRYEEQVRALEATRQHAYGSLEEQLRALVSTSAHLQRETGNLVTALRGSQVRTMG